MAVNERSASDSPGPDPAVTAGLESGGGVQPGDTPPASDSMSGATGDDRRTLPNMGPVAGNRTPMIIALVLIGLLVLGVLGFLVSRVLALGDSADAASSMGVVSAQLLALVG